MERLTSRENALIKEYRKLCGSRKRVLCAGGRPAGAGCG